MNATTFKSMLKPEMGTNNVTDTDHAAQILADAYDLANIGSSCTFFGSTVTGGDKSSLKTMLKTAFDVNKLTNSKDGFIIMATGFCSYWLTATFTPLPMMPPCIAPLKGTTVLFPGNPDDLEKDLKIAFNQPDFDSFVNFLYNTLVSHQTTIAGTYNGNVPAIPSPIPAILPWVGIISAPTPTSGSASAGSAGSSGSGGTGGTPSTGGTGGTSSTGGTGGTGSTDGTGGTSSTGGTGGTGSTDGTGGTGAGGGTSSTGGTGGTGAGGETSSTGGTGGTSSTGGTGGTGAGNDIGTSNLSDLDIKYDFVNFVYLVNNMTNVDVLVSFLQRDARMLPQSIKIIAGTNPDMLQYFGLFVNENKKRMYRIYDELIANNNLKLDDITGYVKIGDVLL